MVKLENKGVMLFFFIVLANIIFYFIWLKLYTLVAVVLALVAMNLIGIAAFKYYIKKYGPEGKLSKKERKKQNKNIILTASALMAGLVLLVSLIMWPFSQLAGFLVLCIGMSLTVIDALITYFILRH